MDLDQPDGVLRGVAKRDQDCRAHGHAAVPSMQTMSVNLPALPDGFQRDIDAAHQCPDGDEQQRVVERPQPEEIQRRHVQVIEGPLVEAHVDDQAHAQVAQAVVVFHVRHTADEQVVGDAGKIHGRNLTINEIRAIID